MVSPIATHNKARMYSPGKLHFKNLEHNIKPSKLNNNDIIIEEQLSK